MDDAEHPDVARGADLLRLTTRIVVAHVGNSHVDPEMLPELIVTVHAALQSAGQVDPVAPEGPKPAVPWKKSVFADYIICLEDGAKLVSLKRRLMVRYGLTPEQYREKWGLPSDYPMVAPGYSRTRSALAKSLGLGRKTDAPPDADMPAEPPIAVTVGRARKARGARG